MKTVLIYVAKELLTMLFKSLVKSAKKVRKTKKKLDRAKGLKNAKTDDDFADNVADDHVV